MYGYRKLTLDMRDLGESCGKHRVARLLKLEGLRSQTGYRRRPGVLGGKPAVVAPNHLQRQFSVAEPNQSWVTDITYIRTHEGWLYLAVVVDLFSRQVVGWSMGSCIDTGLVLDALLMALWRRRPKGPITVHSDQGSQFTGRDWQDFLRDHNLVSSMSRRGNCHDNAVAESFFQRLKRERVRCQTYTTRDDARADVFNYTEMFYNPKRRHGTAGKVYRSPMIDCFDNLAVSWLIGTRPDAKLVNTMLDAAIDTVVTRTDRPVVHSDRGGQCRWPGWLTRMGMHV